MFSLFTVFESARLVSDEVPSKRTYRRLDWFSFNSRYLSQKIRGKNCFWYGCCTAIVTSAHGFNKRIFSWGTKWLQHDVAANNQKCFWNFRRGRLLTCPYPACGPASASQCGLLVTLPVLIWPSEQLMSEIPELIFPNSSTNLVITYVNSVVSVCVEVDCRKQPTYCLR